MKKLVALLLLSCMLLSLFACSKKTDQAATVQSPAASETTTVGTDPSTVEAPTGDDVKYADTITFVVQSDITTLDGNKGRQERTYILNNHL